MTVKRSFFSYLFCLTLFYFIHLHVYVIMFEFSKSLKYQRTPTFLFECLWSNSCMLPREPILPLVSILRNYYELKFHKKEEKRKKEKNVISILLLRKF